MTPANTATTDQFQPSVAAGPGGAVAVAFYDRRALCPNAHLSILPVHRGAREYLYRHLAAGLQGLRYRARCPSGITSACPRFTWYFDQPQYTVGGLTQYPCAAHTRSVPGRSGFIGDYFGLAVSAHNSTRSASARTTHPRRASGPVYYERCKSQIRRS